MPRTDVPRTLALLQKSGHAVATAEQGAVLPTIVKVLDDFAEFAAELERENASLRAQLYAEDAMRRAAR